MSSSLEKLVEYEKKKSDVGKKNESLCFTSCVKGLSKNMHYQINDFTTNLNEI